MALRPPRFERHRLLGDKRTQVVYDLDEPSLDQAIVDELASSGQALTFGPDTVAEARNRGYRLAGSRRPRPQG